MKKANHIILNNKTILDLRQDSVAPESLLAGATAHDKSGQSIEGVAISPTGEITIVANGSYDVASYAVAAINVPKETMEFYDGLVIITRQEPEEEPLDPEFNHYGIIPEGCWMDYYPIEGEQYTLNPGDPFPASYEDMDYCVYAEDNLLYGYGDNDDEVPGDGWYFSEVQQTTTAPSEVRVLESIGSIPVVAIAGMISSIMDEAITSIIIPASIRYINFIVDRFIIPNCPNLKSITYLGTMNEWNAITFAEGWNNGYPEITVTCTDGTITIPAYNS